VSITNPEHLAGELFTDRGSGTLVRLGEPIEARDSLDGLDLDGIRNLLEQSFGRKLLPGYLEGLSPLSVYLAADRSAIAIVTEERGTPYLDKFAVTAESQGAGLGASLWCRLREGTPRLFWRSRTGNPLNPWYFKQADGSWRRGEWIVFWYGLDSADEIARLCDHAAALPATVAPGGVGE